MPSLREISSLVQRHLERGSKYLARWPVALLACLAIGGAVLMPCVGTPGLWEPQERQLADRVAPPNSVEAERAKAEAQQPPAPPQETVKQKCVRSVPKDATARSLSQRAVGWGRDTFGDSDAGRRLPFALMGLLTLLATAGIALRTVGGRAAIVTTIVLVSMPLFVMQSRLITSEIGTACAGSLIVYGLLALRRAPDVFRLAGNWKAVVIAAGDTKLGIAALAAGLAIGFYAGGALLGLLVPIGAVAVAAIASALVRGDAAAPHAGRREYLTGLLVPIVLAGLAAITLIWLLSQQLYTLHPARPGFMPPVRQMFGTAIVPEPCWSWALGGVWRADDDLRNVFDSTFEQIAYGMFPWGLLGPIAMLLLFRDPERERRLVGAVTLAWAGAAWIATETFQRRVGFAIWAGFPAVAIAIGVWLDGVLSRRSRMSAVMPAGALLLGLFLAIGALDLAKDLQSFTEKLTSLTVDNDAIPYRKDSTLLFLKTKKWVLLLGMLVALGAALSLMLWRTGDDARSRLLRRVAGIAAAVALGGSIVLGGFWAFGWQPRMSIHLSTKAMFEQFRELRKQGDQLVIMGDLGHAPRAYVPDTQPEMVMSREQVVAALKRPNRVFAIAPQSELCPLHREMSERPYFVLDDRNIRNLFLSNKLDGGTDHNPLASMIQHKEPANIRHRPKGPVIWDNRIELLGWDMPARVDRGDSFEVTIYYKILKPVVGNWTAIMHFDGAIRFSGDHKPIKDRCPTSTWQNGDYIIDRHTVVAGSRGHPLGRYELWIGFFTGSAPNFKNMPVSTAPGDMRDQTDRVKITSIILE